MHDIGDADSQANAMLKTIDCNNATLKSLWSVRATQQGSMDSGEKWETARANNWQI